MHVAFVTFVASSLFLIPVAASAQSGSACDINGDGPVNVVDVQLVINMFLDPVKTPCTANVAGAGVCNETVIQRVKDAALGKPCVTDTPSHSASLTWTASTSGGLAGYNIYRATFAGGPYTKVNASLVNGTSFTDNSVQAGYTYYYVATAVNTGGAESTYSNQASATIPTP
jgi:hypothetical protein